MRPSESWIIGSRFLENGEEARQCAAARRVINVVARFIVLRSQDSAQESRGYFSKDFPETH
jgi:hypothetical protein